MTKTISKHAHPIPSEPAQRPGTNERGAAPLDRLHRMAHQLGLTCLDTEWCGVRARYHFRCTCGHEYTRAIVALSLGRACPACRDHARLERICEAARLHGGQCIETRYLGSTARYRFVCAEGHQWTALPGDILNMNHWCRACFCKKHSLHMRLSDGLERMQATARAHGGACLSTQYFTQQDRYQFRCTKGHEWEATAANIAVGKWCPRCARAKVADLALLQDGLERLQAMAQAKGGECLSSTYTGMAARYHMRCAKGHDWRAEGSSLLLVGKWCRRCHDESQRSTIEEMHAAAHAHGGRCLSTTYRNSQGKLTWECHRGHVWQAVPSPILQGCWCPECSYDARRDTLENLQKIAAARGGSCLSTTYRNNRTKLTWLCRRGHTWSTTSSAVKFGQWCPTCAHMNKITNPKTLLKYLKKE